MKILVTGGLGNLGLWFVEYFLSIGYDVTVIGRVEKVLIKHERYTFLKADVTDLDCLQSVIGCYYDCCVHTASLNEHFLDNYSKNALLVNALGTDNLCHALSRFGVGKLVYLSTFHVYGVVSGRVTEQTPVRPLNDYGLTHFFAEKYIEKHHRNSGLNYCIFRLTNSYGCPKDKNTDKWYLLLNDLCRAAVEHEKLVLNGDGSARRDFIWMKDVARVVHEALSPDCFLNDCYNLSFGKSLRIADVAKVVVSAYVSEYSKLLPINIDLACVPAADSLVVDNSKLLSEIDFVFSDRLESEARLIMTMLKGANDG
ncbi:MAG: hypothetical protein AXW15_13095 [Neptuniibacter sp. Phe_28]|nr:MAG: hypothetical protein AXW15_13095 [Neptuniibacter sp. Phe_28]